LRRAADGVGMKRHLLTALALTTLATSGCAIPSSPRAASIDSEWVSSPLDLRKVTAVVRTAPPAKLRSQMERVAQSSDDPDLRDFLLANASGGFGSGFLVVHRSSAGEAAFIVTNRHVVAGSDEAEIEFADGTTYKSCQIVFVNPKSDLAVVALPDSALRTFGGGLRPTTSEVHERLTVVATGYPGVDHKPSFQMTEGKISNARFNQPDIISEAVFQHTAPIDPGSSGGPLTNEAGELVGVNVALIRGRSSMFFAVPAAAVTESVRTAHDLQQRRASAQWMTAELSSACNTLAAELASQQADWSRVDSFVSNELVSDEGMASFAFMSTRPRIGALIREGFFHSPIGGMRESLLFRVKIRAEVGGGATGHCGAVNPSDVATIASDKPVRLALLTKEGEMELRWKFAQGSWRVVGGDLIDVRGVMEAESRRERAEAAPAPNAKKAARTGARGGVK
jgi:S1-C subfamily serine protease